MWLFSKNVTVFESIVRCITGSWKSEKAQILKKKCFLDIGTIIYGTPTTSQQIPSTPALNRDIKKM